MDSIEYNLLDLKQMKKGLVISIFLLLFFAVYSKAETSSDFLVQPSFDVPFTITAGIVALWGSYRLEKMDSKAKDYDKSDLLIWDRPFAGVWHPNMASLSDAFSVLGLTPLVIGTVGYFKNDIKGRDLLSLSLMFVQSMAIQSGLNLCVRSLQLWPRPFIYSEKGGEERLKGEAYGSFYSGHASAAFSVAVLTSYWFQKTYNSSKYIPYVWGATLSMATLVSVLRVAAGKHYPTDVVVGALMGSLVSFSVLKLHEHKSPVVSIQVGVNSLSVTRHF